MSPNGRGDKERRWLEHDRHKLKALIHYAANLLWPPTDSYVTSS